MSFSPRTATVFAVGLMLSSIGGPSALAQAAPPAQPVELGKYSAWNAYSAPGKGGKICYALAQPTSRRPNGLNRDPAYFFISNRPRENVRNEISVVIGFTAKPDSKVEIDIGGTEFTLYPRADGAFMQSAEEETKFIAALKGARRNMTMKSTSLRGNVTTDTYSVSGVTAAIERIDRECR
ncbi:hypothetical protein [Methylopila turkensis]|uniref:Uncharacterized protein n=1 Tax=Methylopila turkensis TaxID=1437816 RepID=A0A9W6JPY9_9HYPH|nr:hypothetical protein [Methylopila turkensis]GLK79493.1 hypothetical protein GCM10008174_12340 [Methylopila turkensis]